MDDNIVEFEDFGLKVDLNEVDKMSVEDIQKCKKVIKEIQEKLDKEG